MGHGRPSCTPSRLCTLLLLQLLRQLHGLLCRGIRRCALLLLQAWLLNWWAAEATRLLLLLLDVGSWQLHAECSSLGQLLCAGAIAVRAKLAMLLLLALLLLLCLQSSDNIGT